MYNVHQFRDVCNIISFKTLDVHSYANWACFICKRWSWFKICSVERLISSDCVAICSVSMYTRFHSVTFDTSKLKNQMFLYSSNCQSRLFQLNFIFDWISSAGVAPGRMDRLVGKGTTSRSWNSQSCRAGCRHTDHRHCTTRGAPLYLALRT